MKVLSAFGTRPEIIRLSCVIERLDELCDLRLVHTGQNFDPALSDVFFEELGVREPDRNLGVTGDRFAARVGRILEEIQGVLEEEAPDRILVLGDTDSAMSAYAAKRMGIPVLHMEAGNRCFDDRVPEEVNRRLIDQASDVLMPYTNGSRDNLLREGFHPSQILVTGNPIKEVLDRHEQSIAGSSALADLGVEPQGYLLLTAHRQETTDFSERLRSLIDEVGETAAELDLPVIFSVHPRTRARLEEWGLGNDDDRFRLCDPFGYFDFVALMQGSRCVLTDSGTVQEECCILGVPAITVRDATERPETIECGSNALTGVGAGGVRRCLAWALGSSRSWQPPPEYLATEVSTTVSAIVTGELPPVVRRGRSRAGAPPVPDAL
jgi:UDP-N-acetylglucosamine 2-epimerase (non-hydrolysing)